MTPSFTLTDANRLPADQVIKRLFDRPIVSFRRGRDGTEFRTTRYFRSDGSQSVRCEARSRGYGWQPCWGTTDKGGSRDVAVWRIADPKGVFCLNRAGRRISEENCWSIHEDAGRFAVKPVSGVFSCLPGEIQPQ